MKGRTETRGNSVNRLPSGTIQSAALPASAARAKVLEIYGAIEGEFADGGAHNLGKVSSVTGLQAHFLGERANISARRALY